MRTDEPPVAGDEVTMPHAGAAGAPEGGWLGRFRVDGLLGRGGMGIVLDAFDPELERPVAVKLLRPDVWGQTTDVERARLQREAQAMARLSHPNVVTVYEVGEVGGQSFLAMEKVDGETLRSWQQRPHTATEVIAMYVAVGRGLAAANDAGLVHRDFKPENVLVGRDGRARVGDFGLVAGGFAIGSGDAKDAPVGANLTVRGGVAGTPAYMAPEQWAGGEVDARTDQFAFAVALWEAVYRERPFAGADAPAIRAAVLAGERHPPPRGARAPAWLFPMLARALEREPVRRWPTLTALLDELVRRTTPRRVPLVAVVAAGGLAAGAVAIAVVTREGGAAAEPCPAPADRLAGVWDAAAQARLREHLRGLDPVRGELIFADLARRAERHAGAWQTMHVETCRATRAGTQSDTLHDQRMACLDDRLDELARTAAVTLAVTDARKLEPVLTAWRELSSVDDCADRAIVTAFSPPPAIAARPEAAAIAAEMRDIEVARRAGQLDGLSERAGAALGRARALGHPPLVATGLQRASRVASDRSDAPAAETLLYEATEVAARAGEDGIAADAWNRLLKVIAFDQSQPEKALVLVPAGRAAVARAGDRLTDRVALLSAEADILVRLKRFTEALARLDAARDLLQAAGAATTGSAHQTELAAVLQSIATVHHAAGEYERALPIFREAIAMWDQAHGAGHPDSAFTYINLGESLRRLARRAEAQAAFAEAVRIRETRLGDSPGLAHALGAYGNILREQGEHAAALETMERSVRIARETMPDTHPFKIIALNGLATSYLHAGRDDDARALFDEAIAIGERTGARTANRAIALINRGDLDSKVGDCAAARPRYEQAVTYAVDFAGKDSPPAVMALRRLAQCRLALGDLAGAIEALDRALEIPAIPSLDIDMMIVRHLKGHALIASGRDRDGGRALQAKARRDAEAHSNRTLAIGQLDRVSTWLGLHARAR